MNANTGRYWVETFGAVARYIKERNAASVRGVSRTADSITLRVTDTLNDTLYNYPISIRRPLPSGWTTALVLQGGAQIPSQIKDSNTVRYVIFDAVPDRGDVTILRNGTGLNKPGYGPISAGNLTVWFTGNNLMLSVPSAAGRVLTIALYDLKGAQIGKYTVTAENAMEKGHIKLSYNNTGPGIGIVRVNDGACTWSKQLFLQRRAD